MKVIDRTASIITNGILEHMAISNDNKEKVIDRMTSRKQREKNLQEHYRWNEFVLESLYFEIAEKIVL